MKTNHSLFNEHDTLHELKHYLPAQAPLKDFIHHNTLHAFQDKNFYEALYTAAEMFGYKVSLSLDEYRALYLQGKINPAMLAQVILQRKGGKNLEIWKERLISTPYNTQKKPRIGQLRANWKEKYYLDLDLLVHPILFRTLCSYLDQGIAIWRFPVSDMGFLASIKEIEKNSFTSFFKKERAKILLLQEGTTIADLLHILVGDTSLYKQYLFDQQFAHQGWSGIVSVIEDAPQTLIDPKKISLKELIFFELLLEIDALDSKYGLNWTPLVNRVSPKPANLFAKVVETEATEVISLWQDAYEWSYYDQIFSGIQMEHQLQKEKLQTSPSFQALFCIDDRECSIRRHLERQDNNCQTYGTAGFFGVEFFYKPEHGNSITKQCPAPITPKFLVKEMGTTEKKDREVHFTKHSHTLFSGWLISQSLGFWSALKLALNIFKPSMSPATSSSFRHMDPLSELSIENTDTNHIEHGLQVGFTVPEMAERVENLLRSIGLVKNFAPLVYVVSHGSTSVNNTHYAGYDCGACSGRPGSVNARVICYMANHQGVREMLKEKGIEIPAETQFIGALHDTTRDDIAFYDKKALSPANLARHKINKANFKKALDENAKERSRRFESIDTSLSAEKIHEKVRTRSVSLFEPRPELNHATNALCIVGRRNLSKNLFLDRRSFMNSFDYQADLEGAYLATILNAVAPVCGGINLEYYFSRTDNHKLGAGTKIAHNVMGLFGVANGIDGDLRPGLPSQMIEVHDPIRLMVIVEHFPKVVLAAIRKNPATYQWFEKEWIHLMVINPETKEFFLFKDGAFSSYTPIKDKVAIVSEISPLLEATQENIPVYYIPSQHD
ncbi:MAG: YbcC family protein [Bacteroidia bacterium]